MPPEMLYKQRKVPTDARPVLGRSLVTNHVLPFNINETTVKKRHDLLQVIHLKVNYHINVLFTFNTSASLLPEKWAGHVYRGKGYEVKKPRFHL